MKVWGLIALALSLALAGCASHSPDPERAAFRPTPGKGVIVGTATHTENGVDIAVTFAIGKTTERFGRTVRADSRSMVISGSESGGANKAAVKGTAFAFEVDPGEYELSSWSLAGEKRFIRPLDAEPRRFTVGAGEVVYIGNLHMTYETETLVGAIKLPTLGHPSINDFAERDIPLIKAKYEALADSEIRRRPLSTGPWPSPTQRVEFATEYIWIRR